MRGTNSKAKGDSDTRLRDDARTCTKRTAENLIHELTYRNPFNSPCTDTLFFSTYLKTLHVLVNSKSILCTYSYTETQTSLFNVDSQTLAQGE